MQADMVPAFNLWSEPWIDLELVAGGRARVGIADALLRAHELRAIVDPSPLVIAGTHRLLVAILQAIYDPQRPGDLARLRSQGCFPPAGLDSFGEHYAERFGLFSVEAPFMQSADLPLRPQKGDDLKSVSQLTVETSRSTALDHYRHGRALDEQFCPACAARGLLCIPAFASAGGRGIRPSINGVPPVYVLPGGVTLFESLWASLLLPDYQPAVRSREEDRPWWVREPVVRRGQEVFGVGYLQSLTFAARRVRLHPQRIEGTCSRCGEASEWGVRTMIFEAGEHRSKEAPFWQDPFAAYRAGKADKGPIPVRPRAGVVLWREYASLFLARQKDTAAALTMRPLVLDQISDLTGPMGAGDATSAFRCVGLRTDMKAKVFEWVDAGFDVPSAMLGDEDAALHVGRALDFAGECDHVISFAFRQHFGGSSKKSERNRRLKEQMLSAYWGSLAAPFRDFTLALAAAGAGQERLSCSSHWADNALRTAQAAFLDASRATGDDAVSLRQRVQGEAACRSRLWHRRGEFWAARED